MAVISSRSRTFNPRPITAAKVKRRRFPMYFEMDSASMFIGGVTLLALTCLLYLVQTTRVSVLGYQIQQVQAQQAEAQRETDNLIYQISLKQSLPEIERYAREKLKMRPIREYKYLPVNVRPEDLKSGDHVEEQQLPGGLDVHD
ncbi:hypothetical protein Tter_1615 [Thermobaculum terrenum ATCC BAA-798]|uniref:Cell division protein FtsL n=1 Tax=Thermobaculum terrenum (strain ATCC BAA-798 / CCMEE 7001 / YNP1) TaxID=525904 RepID=D1CCK6_THET1|nr:hypothetical protein [Thermobaculum terrenum]ACZ42521.1 hypothetical protein Tter_1615 [Thermobaculum terrenum ATCC BAA-798]